MFAPIEQSLLIFVYGKLTESFPLILFSVFFFNHCVVLLLKTENNNSGSWFQSHIDDALTQFIIGKRRDA